MTRSFRSLHRARPGTRLAAGLAACALAGIIGILTTLTPRPAAALPIYAAREGLSCKTCHVDPSGGGMRNAFGFDYMRERHAITPEFRFDELPEHQPEAAPGLAFGTDLRFNYYGLNRRGQGSFLDAHSSFIRMQTALYLAYVPIEALTIYLGADLEQVRFQSAEWFGMLRGDWLGPGGYLRVGSFRLPYGLRMDDHTVWVRNELRVAGLPEGWTLLGRGGDPRLPDVGLEVGWLPGRFFAQLAVTNGSGGARDSSDRNLAFTTRAGYQAGRLLAGLTAHLDTDEVGETSRTEVRRYGAYGTLRVIDDLVLLGEVNLGEDTDLVDRQQTRSLLAWAEADYFIRRDARVRFRYDYLNTDRDLELAAVERFAIEVDWTPVPFFSPRVGYRYTSNELGPELDELLAVFHLHF
jgi:hypothetical protein